MPRISLSNNEIDELVNSYKSSLKKMRFQIVQVTETINQLQAMKKERIEAKEVKALEKEQAVKVKATRKKTAKKKAPKRRKKRVTSGYRLSEWDQFLIDTIKENNLPMSTAELQEAATRMVTEKRLEMTEEDIKGKIARSLQKLANRRKDLGKAPGRGKGYVYGLSDWFFARSGRLKKAYQP
jgi:hypothetical protein